MQLVKARARVYITNSVRVADDRNSPAFIAGIEFLHERVREADG
jgi:hypothetical protein